MACLTQKQLDNIFQSIGEYFKDIKDPLDYKHLKHLLYIYNFGISEGVQPATALSYVQAIPKLVNTYKSITGIKFHRDENIALATIESDFDDNDLDFVATYLGLNTQKDIKEKETITEKEFVAPEGKVLNLFQANPNDPNSTTGPDERVDPQTQKRDPKKSWYHNFVRRFLDIAVTGVNASGVTIQNHTGFKLKAIKMSEIPYEELFDFLKRDGVSETLLKTLQDNDQTVALVITDNDGNILKFNEDYSTSTEGKMIYFQMRDTGYDLLDDKAARGAIQSVREIAKNLRITEKEAEERVRTGVENLRTIQRGVFENKTILLDIVGGSPGYIPRIAGSLDVTWETAPTTLGDLVKNVSSFQINYSTIGKNTAERYVIINGETIPLLARKATDEELDNFTAAAIENILKSKDKSTATAFEFLSEYFALNDSHKKLLEKLLDDIQSKGDENSGLERLKLFLETGGTYKNGFFLTYQKELPTYLGIKNREIAIINREEYYNFWKDKLKTPIPLNDDNEVALFNSYLNFEMNPETRKELGLDKREALPVETPVTENKLIIGEREWDDNLLTKEFGITSEASKKQIRDAHEWYLKSPLNDVVKFEPLFRVPNGNAKATWGPAGITLYFGSNYTDLYHEAWHAFSQLFLTIEQKEQLYKEVGKMSGTFLLPSGVRIKYSDAKPLQIEELLAEDFRQYRLSNGTKVFGERPVTNGIFAKILKFLNWLFDNTTYQQTQTDFNTIKNVKTLYDKLYLGNFIDMKPDTKNIMFKSLASPIGNIEKGEMLTVTQSDEISDSIDFILSDALEKTAKKKGRILISEFLGSKESIKYVYTNVKQAFEDKLVKLKEDVEKNAYAISVIQTALNNFGDINDTIDNKKLNDSTTISYHLRSSKILDFKTKTLDESDEKNVNLDTNIQKQLAENGELSFEDMANEKVLFLIRTLKQYDSKGNLEMNNLGFPKLTKYNKTLGNLIRNLNNNSGPKSIKAKLEELYANGAYEMGELLTKLGNLDLVQEDGRSDIMNAWILFANSFNTTSLPLIITRLEQSISDNPLEYEYTLYNTQGKLDLSNTKRKFTREFAYNKLNTITDLDNGERVISRQKLINVFGKVFDGGYKTLKDTDPAKFEFAVKFYNAIGIPISNNEEYRNLLSNKTVLEGAWYIYDMLINYKENKLIAEKIPNHLKYLTSSKDNQSNVIDTVIEAYLKVEDIVSTFSLLNAEGNRQYENVLNNTITIIKNGINEGDTFKDFYSKPEFAHYNPNRNPMVRNSLIFKKLFGEELNNRVDTLELQNYSGIQLDKDGVNVNSLSINDTDGPTKFYIDFYSYINNGYIELPRHADKKLALAYFASKNPHFINPSTYLLESELGDKFFFNAMFGYLKAEHERIQDIRNNTISDLDYFPDFKNQGKEFLIFHDILTTDQKNELYDMSVEDLKNLNSDTELYKSIEEQILSYLSNLTADNKKVFDEVNYVDQSTILKLAKTVKVKLTQEQKTNRLLRAYSANSFISFVESTTLFYGDIAAYNLLKEEFHKRNASAGSTGKTFVSDPEILAAFNKHYGYQYSKKQGYKNYGIKSNGILNVAVFDDIQIQNDDLIAEYEKIFEDQYTKDFTAFGLKGKALTDRVKLEVDKAIKKYFADEIKEGDGQGWLTFDAYRMLAKLSNEWSKAQEDLYNKIVEGKEIGIDEVLKNFPPRKYQYYGPVTTDKYHLNALHKFSLMPLIPSVLKDKNLSVIHDRMMKNNVHYATFKSGSKTATRSYKNGKSDNFYQDLSTRTAMPASTPLMINQINLKYLRNQVSINDEFKEEVVFSTQMRKLIINELFEKGIPLNTNVENLVKSYLQNIDRYIEFNKQELRDEIELKSDGKFNAESLAKIIKKEMTRRDFPEHLIDTVTKIENGNFAYDLSYALNAEDIEKILFSIVNKRIVRRKVNGEPLVQAAVSGFESIRPDLTNASEQDKEKYKASTLKFYRRDPKTGKTLPMQVKIALQGKFKKLLYLEHNGEVIKTRERLNIALKDENWMKKYGKMVTLVGVRIPVQGFNSMEMMEVAEFLEETAGNIVVAPTEIVSKSGGDFDIDKLSIFFPNIEKVGKNVFLSKFDKSVKLSTGQLKTKIAELKERIKEIKSDSQQEFENLKKQKEFSKLADNEKQIINTLYEKYNRLVKENNDLISLWSNESIKTRNGKILSNEIDELKNISISFEDKFQELTLAEAELKQNLKVYYGAFFQDKQQKFWDVQDKKLEIVFDEMNALKENLINSSNSAHENAITEDIINILSAPEIAAALVRPNDTDLVQPLSKDMLKYFAKTYNPKKNFNDDPESMKFIDDLETDPKKKVKTRPVSPTRIFETRYNIYKQFSNSVGKKALGIGAVDNAYNALFNQVGLYLNDTFEHVRKDKKTGKKIVQIRKNRLLLNHNRMANGTISLSNIFNTEGTKISDLINQLINGWVDVAKDPWIAYVMGTPEASPSLLYLIQAGVPFKQAVYFLANPLVREYFDTLKKMDSPLAALQQSRQLDKKGNIIDISTLPENEFKLKTSMLELDMYANGHDVYRRILELTKGIENITEDQLKDRLEASLDPTWTRDETDMAVFAHFLEILDVSKGLFKIKQALNFDTKTSATMYDAYVRSQKKDEVIGYDEDEINILRIFPKDRLKALYSDTILSNFDVGDLQMEMFKELYEVRNHTNLNKYLSEFYSNSLLFGSNIYDRVKQIFGGNDKMISEFKNDFTTAITLRAFRDIDISEDVYKGYEVVQVNSKEYERVINKKVNKALPKEKLHFAKNNYTKDTAPNYPKYGFIFTENAEKLGTNYNVSRSQAVIRTNQQGERNPNALAIVTKKMQKVGANFTNSEADFNQFKELNTELINNIVNSKFERIIVPTGGFAMEKAKLPTRFAEWLQNELQTKLGIATELVDRGTGMSGLTNSKKYEEPTTQQSINPLVEAGIKPTDMSGNAAKDIEMASESTQFIGFGTIMKEGATSSTDKYAKAWGNKANTGEYTANDTIMVSGSGNFGRGGVDKTEEAAAIKKTLSEKYKPLLNKAIEAGASFRIGNQYAKGNLSDETVAKYLEQKGYTEEKLNGYSRWTAPVTPKGEKVADGIYVNQEGLSQEEELELFELIRPVLEKQAVKSNAGKNAPKMAGLSLNWDYVNGVTKRRDNGYEKIDIQDPLKKNSAYGWFTSSATGEKLGSISKRMVELMTKATGIDVTDYDGSIINIYNSDSFIGNHPDIDESKTAEKYPVVVVNIGGPGNIVLGSDKVNLKSGAGYVFGVGGKNRTISHSTYASPIKGTLPSITTQMDGETLAAGSYRVSITMRRVMPLEKGMPESPKIVSEKSSNSANEFDVADKLTPIEQNFVDGQGGRQMQSKFKDKSTMDLIISGDRTRTTRAKTDIQRMAKDYNLSKISDLVGKVIRMTDNTGRQVYTRITKVAPFTQEYQDATWEKEGWEKSVTDKNVGNYPYAIEFEVVNKPTQPIEVQETLAKGTNIPGYIPIGVYIQDGKMYVDKDTLYDQFQSGEYSNNNTKAYGAIINTPEGGKYYLEKVSPLTFNNNFSEYVRFVMEREYQRSILKASDITNFDKVLLDTIAQYKDKVFVPGGILKTNTDEMIKFLTETATMERNNYGYYNIVDRVNGQVYYENLKKVRNGEWQQFNLDTLKAKALEYKLIEKYITNKALKNILNSYSYMQDPTNAYAIQLFKLTDLYENLKKDYSILEALTFSKSKTNGIFNLIFKEGQPDTKSLNNYNEELKKLADVGVEKHPDIHINKEISEFFDKFQYYVLLSTGFSSGSQYSLNSIISQDKILNFTNSSIIKKTTNRILNDSNYAVVKDNLDKFTDKFLKYRLGITLDANEKIANYTPGFSTDNANRMKRYTASPISKPISISNAKPVNPLDDTLRQVNDSLYLVDLQAIREEGTYSNDKLFFTKALTQLAETHDDKLFIFTSKDNIPATVKASNISILNTAEQIKNVEFEGSIILPRFGLKVQNETETAEISKELFDKFKVTNPGFENQSSKLTIREMMNSDSFIASIDVINSVRIKSHAILDELNNSCKR